MITKKKTWSLCVAAGTSLALAQTAVAGTGPYFAPLTQSTAVATPNHVNEINSPWQTPAGITQEPLTSMAEIEAEIDQSVVRAPGASTSASMWDMIAFDPTGRYLFIPHETPYGAGVSRYDLDEDRNVILFSGDDSGIQGSDGTWANDFGAFDPARFTPYGTVIAAEEWSGEGRVIEIDNPYDDPARITIREKQSFANVSHEGLSFGITQPDTVYYIDEDRSGSIYKLVASDETFDHGQTFVLAVDAFDGDASQNYNAPVNDGAIRTGLAHWIPVTDAEGNPLTAQDPFENAASFRAGRIAADELGATPYGRPEDTEIAQLANGNEILYFAATSEAAVYSVEMIGRDKAIVRLFLSETDTPKNVGFPATTGVLNAPDNLAQDALGNIYVIEDAPNGSDVGGDIWFARDIDSDGVAESLDHFMSIQVSGAEATGMAFDPVNPTRFVVAVQHPSSTNLDAVPDGRGDALWAFDLKDVVPPACRAKNDRGAWSWFQGWTKTCSNDRDFNFVRKLERTVKQKHDKRGKYAKHDKHGR